MMRKGKQTPVWVLRATGILLGMVLVSTYLVCGLFARYTTSASGSDSARVAKFEISEQQFGSLPNFSQVISAAVTPGIPYVTAAQVVNSSEVAVEYEITVSNLTGNLPLEFIVFEDPAAPVVSVDGSCVFSDDMAPGTDKTYTLQILCAPSTNQQALEDMGKVDQIVINLSATQID